MSGEDFDSKGALADPVGLEEDTGSYEDNATRQVSSDALRQIRESAEYEALPWLQKVREREAADQDDDAATKAIDRSALSDIMAEPPAHEPPSDEASVPQAAIFRGRKKDVEPDDDDTRDAAEARDELGSQADAQVVSEAREEVEADSPEPVDEPAVAEPVDEPEPVEAFEPPEDPERAIELPLPDQLRAPDALDLSDEFEAAGGLDRPGKTGGASSSPAAGSRALPNVLMLLAAGALIAAVLIWALGAEASITDPLVLVSAAASLLFFGAGMAMRR